MFRKLEYKWLVAIVFVIGMFMDTLDTTIVNVAIPKLGAQLGAGASIQWVATGYMLSLAVWIPGSGWIGDKFGTKKVFLFALTMFTAASALCGAAESVNQLIAFRILQGVGGGMLTPVGTAMLYRAFPPAERARASAVLTIPIVIAPALGPVLGGFIVDNFSWRWIFYINLPIGALGIVFASIFLKEEKQPRSGSFDIMGFLLSGAGLAMLLYGLDLAHEVNEQQAVIYGWSHPFTLAMLGGGALCFSALVFVETRVVKQPMLHLRLFGQRMFRNGNITAFLTFGGFIAGVFLLPFYVQTFRGESALTSGLVQLPQAIGVILVGRVVAIKYPQVGPKRFLLSGVLGASLATLGLLFVGATTPLLVPAALFFVRGVFMAQVFIPLNAATFSQISGRETGNASALYQTTRQIGSSLAVALAFTIMGWRLPIRIKDAVSSLPATADAAAHAAAKAVGQVGAFHDAVLACGIISLLGIVGVLLIRDEDAAASMGKKSDDGAGAH
jgi:EmrB/QacA subfamily drug resistance transporter